MLLFFEGSEKKAEIIVDNHQFSLLNDISDDFWQLLVERCQAKIISSIQNESCKAFLLSESSLFVWSDRMLILTCGNTRLVHSVEYFIQQIGVSRIQQINYQRKNEYFAHAQLSSFGDDVEQLSQYVKAKAFRFGELDGHHNYIFHHNQGTVVTKTVKSYELIAYQISPDVSKKLTSDNLTAAEIRKFLDLDTLLIDYVVDDFAFQPCGYSINAIKGSQYLTIHITPQATNSYVSIQSNIDLFALLPEFLNLLAPKSVDLLSFNEAEFKELVHRYMPERYICQSLFHQHINDKHLVCFANYILPQGNFSQAILLDTEGERHAL